MITDINDYFSKGCGRCDRFATPDCATQTWNHGLKDLRRICLEQGLAETLKWGHPCYMHAGHNIVIFGAFRGDFRLSFFNAALMRDPEGLLERSGPNTRHPDMIRFADTAQVAGLTPVIRSYIKEAMGYAKAGIKPANEESALDLPDELVAAMDADPALAEAFHSLTPGRKKSYVIHLSSAKTSATRMARMARIAKLRPNILAGKGATER